jgi:hypothetical protein
MLNRREFVASSVALSAVTPAAAARMAAREAGDPAKYFIAARDVPEAHPAARAAAARGTTVIWLGADVTPVYTVLDLELRTAPFAVAGLTSGHHLFVLERLSWDRGLRTVRRAERGTVVDWRLEPRNFVSGTTI